MATDLTQVSFRSVNGEPIVQIAEATLASGNSMRQVWDQLEPLVRTLIDKVSAEVTADQFEAGEAAKLLSLCATVVHKVGAASQGMLKASEGLSKLSLLLSAGTVKRRTPAEMTQKQLAAVVLETARKIKTDTGACPVCTVTVVAGADPPLGLPPDGADSHTATTTTVATGHGRRNHDA